MKLPIKAILVDDEPIALSALQKILVEYCPHVNIVGTATNIVDALKLSQETHPNLVFLDIEMSTPNDGFNFFRLSPPNQFGVIITTAHAEYALRAIKDIQPWGYLLKPFEATELIASVQAAEQKLPFLAPTVPQRKGITLNDPRQGNVVIKVDDILYLAVQQSTVDIVVWKNNKRSHFITYKSLKDFEESLPAPKFCRTHHKYLVNLAWVERYERTGRNGIAHLPSGDRVEISVQKMEDFVRQFEDYLQGR
ncbi:MAG: LytTR family DNA-binding domain-containing protein [Saprospiraceae bacterium]|nr:LytTR family DNA-binding domain-containing protein [Anaerolineales bacterium]